MEGKTRLAIFYETLLFAVILWALWAEIFSSGTVQWGAFLYFTIESNALVAATLLLLIFAGREHRLVNVLSGTALVAITLTGLVYNTVLYKLFLDWGGPGYTASRTITHLVAPLGFLLDWLAFGKHGQFRLKDALAWLAYPIVYVLFSIGLGLVTKRYLYFFFDVAGNGLSAVKWLAILLAALLGIAFLYILLDRLLGFPGRSKRR